MAASTTTLDEADGKVVRRAAGALVVYGAAKASVVAAPVFLSTVLPFSQYGLVEYSLSIGQMVSVALSLGMHGSVPYFLIKRRQSAYGAAFSLHVIAICLICIAASLVAAVSGYPATRLVTLIAGIAVAQFVTTAKFQSAGRPMGSSLAEVCLYLILLGYAALAVMGVLPRSVESLSATMTAYLVGVLIWNLVRFPWSVSRSRLWRTYRASVRYGVTLLPATFANVGLVSVGRTLIGVTGSLDQVAVYSLAYRLCVPLVAIHQFLTNFRFKRLYESTVREFERYFAILTGLLFCGALCTIYLGPWVSAHVIGSPRMPGIGDRTGLFTLMSVAMISWSQLSLMELFMNREARTLVQLPGLALGCAVTLLSLVLPRWAGADPVDQVALFQGLGFVIAVFWQFRVSGVPRPRWPLARLLVACQAAVLVAVWLLTAMRRM